MGLKTRLLKLTGWTTLFFSPSPKSIQVMVMATKNINMEQMMETSHA
jgi:hypothetical protein